MSRTINSHLNTELFYLARQKELGELALAFLKERNIDYNQNKVMADYRVRTRAVITGQQTVELPIPNAAGVYPDGEHLWVFGFKVMSGVEQTIEETDWINGISDALAKNGFMGFNNNGTVELKDMPMTFAARDTVSQDESFGVLALSKPIFVQAQTNAKVVLSFPVPPTTADLNIDVEWWGLKLI